MSGMVKGAARRWLLLAALALVLGAVVPMPDVALAAPTVYVDDTGTASGTPTPAGRCGKPNFNSIQAAVTAAPTGSTVIVCPGTYPEQVAVPKSLTLRGSGPGQSIIQAPPTIAADVVNSKSIVRITGAGTKVTLERFTITGPGPGPCDSIRFGVRVDGNATATIQHNHITEIRDTPFSGCQNGIAVLVGRVSEGQVGTATIRENLIDKYQKNGPTVSNAGSSAVIERNVIRGIGPTNVIAQNGVQVSGGATATVERNAIADNLYSPQTFASTGVLLFEPAGVEVSKNHVTRNDVDIFATPADGAIIEHNEVSAATFDGIALLDTSDAQVRNNRSENNGFDGIYAGSDTANNTIRNNKLSGNDDHDCHDDSVGPFPPGVANIWKNNKGQTENKPGLCKGPGGDGDHDDDDGDGDHDDDDGHTSAESRSRSARSAGARPEADPAK